MSEGMIVTLVFALFFLIMAWSAVKVVPQSQVFIVERFGKFSNTLNAGINFVIPMIDQVRHRISILERQLPAFEISVITRDNVEVIQTSSLPAGLLKALSPKPKWSTRKALHALPAPRTSTKLFRQPLNQLSALQQVS